MRQSCQITALESCLNCWLSSPLMPIHQVWSGLFAVTVLNGFNFTIFPEGFCNRGLLLNQQQIIQLQNQSVGRNFLKEKRYGLLAEILLPNGSINAGPLYSATISMSCF